MSVLITGLAASGVYAAPECGMGMSAMPVKMDHCGGEAGCYGCEMQAALPYPDYGKIASGPVFSLLEVNFEASKLLPEPFRAPRSLLPRDRGEEGDSPPGNLYDLYSDYRI
jgi:hypothetical protein